MLRVQEDGKREVRFDRAVDDGLLERIGHVPLPPYIRREPGAPDRPEDREAYQTVFAREPLAVAAPTAGLHFTEEILERIRARGCAIADLTLAVGPGTFKPVTVEDTGAHVLDAEEVGDSGPDARRCWRKRARPADASSPSARRSPGPSKPRRVSQPLRPPATCASRPISSSRPASSSAPWTPC